MMRTLRSQRGVALLAALGAVVLIGVIIAGILFAVTQDYRISDNSMRQSRAATAAEFGLNRIRVDWLLTDNTKLKKGDTLRRSFAAPGGATAGVMVTRLNGPYFWIVSEGYAGTARNSSARRRYGMLMRLDMPQMNVMGAITTQGNTTINGNVSVSGNDGAPASWTDCGNPAAPVAGAAISPTTTATVNGSVTLAGNPQVLYTPAAADTNTYFNYGGQSYQSLAATANLVYPAGTQLTNVLPIAAGGACVPSLVPANWGEPTHNPLAPSPCESYFPVIHVLGNLKVTTGRGQGILLVDGDLETAGNFQFTGAVIVRGGLKMTGTGNKIVGATLAASVSVDDNVALSGNTSVSYSSCALMTALSANAYPKPAKQRAWVDVY